MAADQPSVLATVCNTCCRGECKSHWIIQEGCVQHRHKPTCTCRGNFFNCCHILKVFHSINLTLVCPVPIPSFILNTMMVQKMIYLITVSLCMFLCHIYGGDRSFECTESTTTWSSEPRGVQAKVARGEEKWW